MTFQSERREAKQTAPQQRLSVGHTAVYHLLTEYRAGATWLSDQPARAIDQQRSLIPGQEIGLPLHVSFI